MKYKKIILDADICIKLGQFTNEKLKFLQELIPLIAEKAYIHKYVYDEEILTPNVVKNQIDNLIGDNIVEILSEEDLSIQEKDNYDSICNTLKPYMINPQKPRKNLGELKTISMAKVKSIPYFVSDEGNLQGIIDTHVNIGLEEDINLNKSFKVGKEDIKVLRVKDLLLWIKENNIPGIKRKTAKAIWTVAIGKDKIDYFNNEIWPI